MADLVDEEGLSLVRAHLAEGGLYLVNAVSGANASRVHELALALEKAFSHVQVLLATDEGLSDDDNFLIVASDAELDFEDAL